MTINGADDDDEWSTVSVADGATSELVLEQAPRGGLAGRVRESGAPLAGATLSLTRRADGRPNPMLLAFGGRAESARTDADGRYSFDDVETGEYTLTASHPTRRMDATFDVDVDEGTNRFDAELGVSVIEGRVLDVEGNALPGIRVSAEQVQGQRGFVRANFIMMTDDGSDAVVTSGSGLGAESSTTDQDGRYRLRGVRPDVDLVVRGRGDRVQEGTSETVRLANDEVKRNVDFVLELGGSVEVEAVLADGAPARFCMVNARYEDDGARVAPQFGFIQNGSTTLKGLRPGKWRVTVTRAGPGGRDDSGKEQVVEVEAGTTERVTVTMD
jgi:protocatechuate 3,4-dioxygenase beta subunit